MIIIIIIITIIILTIKTNKKQKAKSLNQIKETQSKRGDEGKKKMHPVPYFWKNLLIIKRTTKVKATKKLLR